MPDVVIIGGGPAGLSAALTLRSRGKSVLIAANAAAESSLKKAERVENYPGLPSISGEKLLDAMTAQAAALGAEFLNEKVLTAMSGGDKIYISAGQEVLETSAVILAVGAQRGKPLPGEAELLGAGVSYCATCDGMLYRGKHVAVLGFSEEAEEEAAFLRSIGCDVLFCDAEESARTRILGTSRVEGIETDGRQIPVDGVFVLRDTVAPAALFPGLALRGSQIAAERDGSTNIPGVFAAGDCTGAPYQIAKAVGEGNIAALSAVKYLDRKVNESK